MQVSTLAQELAEEFGEVYSDLDVATQFQNWVIEGVTQVYSAVRWLFQNKKFSLNALDTIPTYTLDGTVAEVIAIVDTTTGSIIPHAGVQKILARGYQLASVGDPAVVWMYDETDATGAYVVRLIPVPNASRTYDVHVLLRTPALTSTSEIPLSVDYIPAVREYVRRLAHTNDRNIESARDSTQMFSNIMGQLFERFGPMTGNPSNLRIKTGRGVTPAPDAS